MSLFCLKNLFIGSSKKDHWSELPEDLKKKVIEYLDVKEKARLSLTSKCTHLAVKSLPTSIKWLQFSPIRYNAKCAEIIISFKEELQYSFHFERAVGGCSLKVTRNGEVLKVRSMGTKGFREAADECFQGWLTGTEIDTLDVRGDYNGTIPKTLKISTFSYSDKYNRPSSAIPAWLDSIPLDSEVNFLLMSDHWEKILGHKLFSNPTSTCKLIGYDGIGHENVEKIQCRQIELNNIKDEKAFNVIVKKWVSGGFPNTFEWLVVTNATRPFKSEQLLADINVQQLDSKIFEESYREMQEHNSVEYFLVFGEDNKKFGVFCGIDNFARFSVVNKDLVEKIPELGCCYFEKGPKENMDLENSKNPEGSGFF
ncbi:unnamed protein product [Caenorhabditis brenneri]